MKKLSSIILALIFIMSMFVPVTVGATFSEENITVVVNAFNIDITVTSETQGTVIAHLTNEAKNQTFGLDYDEMPEETDGVYTYTFSFEMEKTAPTQKLYLRVGDAVPTTEKLINFANINDKNTFYNGLEAVTDPSLVDEYLSANKAYTSMDIPAYLELSEDIRALVSVAIVDLELSTGYENLADEADEYTAAKVLAVAEVETLFNTTFTEVMKYAKIADADEAEWTTVSATAMNDGLFDDEYFTENASIPALLTVDAVYPYFVKEVKVVSELSETEIKKAFDRATLMAIEEKLEYNTVGIAFLYFENKGTITVSDMTNIDAIVTKGKDADLWKDVKAGTYTDCATLITKAVEIAFSMVENGVLNDNPTGGIGGGNVTTPSSPGGFTGGGMGGGGVSSKPETKPEVPEKPEVPTITFSDIAAVDWAKESIEALAAKGVLAGKGDGKFAPNDSVTREEFVKIIVAAFELTDDKAESDFNDVSKDSWSYPYISVASKLSIVSGDGTSFNPARVISRQDMAVIIYRVFEHLGADVSGSAISFDDDTDIAGYAKNAVETLTAAGIINGMGDGTFAPAGTVTRAQAAKVVYGLLNIIGGGK